MSESYQNTVEMVEGHYKPGLFNPEGVSSTMTKVEMAKKYPIGNVKCF